jgi:hypothetical protein
MAYSYFDDKIALIRSRGSGGISDIYPDVIIEETYDDKLQITAHPVETGGTISDHAYLRPKSLDMRIAWADNNGDSRAKYESLLRLQASREAFFVSTGKRNYENMMISSITVANDQRTRHAVFASVRMDEVIIVNARTGGGSGNQADPKSTQAPVSSGQQQPVINTSEVINPVRAFDLSGASADRAPNLVGVDALEGVGSGLSYSGFSRFGIDSVTGAVVLQPSVTSNATFGIGNT